MDAKSGDSTTRQQLQDALPGCLVFDVKSPSIIVAMPASDGGVPSALVIPSASSQFPRDGDR